MKIELKIDPTCEEPRVLVLVSQVTEEVTSLIKRLNQESPRLIAGFREDTIELLDQESLIRIYAQEGKVLGVTEQGSYQLRLRLYELEERLDKGKFVRVSHSEIINLKWVRAFDLSLAGTICVVFSNGDTTYVSRRYVSKIKHTLGI